ncbi:MAG TPA: glycerol-3-phosphate acyltransferase [Rhodospirillaceae bacterium]|nr:MAG: glycerol-3-phosphate dehydrogenase [Alphaproteobacteria bacterium GWF2_58_20]HAU28682.1 glycerol-3-phosphate acyltransferase [Rhodospirillaceae bacterium]
MTIRTIGVIGGGAWGTALAAAARRTGCHVMLWAREKEVVDDINLNHRNDMFLPGIDLASDIRATGDLAQAARADALLLVIPAQHLRSTCKALEPHLEPGKPLVICSKGIEQKTGALMSQVVAETLPEARIAVLSGPTFAAEVARGLPTAVTLAVEDAQLGQPLIEALGSKFFRPYLSNDIVGTEIAGAVKNVIAIACGIVHGNKLGDNARAAIIARGLAEISRLGLALGGQRETLMSLAGFGDLTLTCTSMQSRNFSLGAALGAGRSLSDILEERHSVAEGVATAPAVLDLAAQHGVEMPICAAVDAMISEGQPVEQVLDTLLSRPFKTEIG